MNRSVSLVAGDKRKVPESAHEFFNLSDRILLHGELAVRELLSGKLVLGKSAVGEVVTGEIVLGNLLLGK